MPEDHAMVPASANKSRPVYAPLRRDESGERHLLIVDREPIPQSCLADGLDGFAGVEAWTVVQDSRLAVGPAATDKSSINRYRSSAQLLALLELRLARENIGFRLYAIGSEAFIWDAAAIARTHGLGPDEVFLCAADHSCRRVYCIHCRTMNHDVATSLTRCVGCGAQLLVRDHFSRRLAAFMGVQADAECAGELPTPERFA
jgi:hypothetical protein